MINQGQLKKVALIGRTNVGKSTLFNKLSEKHLTMVSSEPGTTRDLKYATINWQSAEFELIDSGGLDTRHLVKRRPSSIPPYKGGKQNNLNWEIVNKALKAVKQADLILFIVDARSGLTVEDREIAHWLLRRSSPLTKGRTKEGLKEGNNKPPSSSLLTKEGERVLLVANKADGQLQRYELAEFTKLGFGEPFAVSAATGAGTGDLLDEIISLLPPLTKGGSSSAGASGRMGGSAADQKTTPPPTPPCQGGEKTIKVAIIGRPNVGKSTLLNQLLGEPRAIVSPIPHTTREPIDTLLTYNDQTIELIDTAGIRKKARIRLKSLEKQGVALSLKALKQADITLFVFDLSKAPASQDQKLISEIIKARTGLIIIANKVDLLKGKIKSSTYAEIEKNLHRTFSFARFAPMQIISALSKKRVNKIFDTILEVATNMHREVNPGKLTHIVMQAAAKQPPHKKKTAKVRPSIKGIKQSGMNPPRFTLSFKAKHLLPIAYLKYIEKAIRANFDFTGTPIIIEQIKL